MHVPKHVASDRHADRPLAEATRPREGVAAASDITRRPAPGATITAPVAAAGPRLPERERRQRILSTLATLYPDARTELHHQTPFQLLVATVLSAQCTDRRVNLITARLFPRHPDPAAIAAMAPEALQAEIRDCGLFRTKARHIRELSRLLLERHGGQVPRERAALEALPGVGRKTASVVLWSAFGIPALAVDTHVLRVSHRLALAHDPSPPGTERELCRRIPRALWGPAHHWLILHGRRVCTARTPRCRACPLLPYCPEGIRRTGPDTPVASADR